MFLNVIFVQGHLVQLQIDLILNGRIIMMSRYFDFYLYFDVCGVKLMKEM